MDSADPLRVEEGEEEILLGAEQDILEIKGLLEKLLKENGELHRRLEELENLGEKEK